MPDMRKVLTRCEYAMWERLHEEKLINWYDAIGCEVQTLNRLVKKGAVTRLYEGDSGNKKDQYWVIK